MDVESNIIQPQNAQPAEVPTSYGQTLAADAFEDPVFFLQFFLPHLFPGDVPWVHRGTLAILLRKTDFLLKYGELDKIISNFTWKEDPEDPESLTHSIFTPELDASGNILAVNIRITKCTEIMLPRGFSKTTLAGIGIVLFWILYLEKRFTVYISESSTHAEMQLGNVRSELEGNERIRAVFGNVVPDRQSSLKWTGDMLQTTTGATVVARGRGGQVRGLNIMGQRPDNILLDDVEDRDSVKTDDQRTKAKTWMYGDIIPALPEMQEDATIVALGTLLHSESLLMTLHKDPEWTSIIFGVRDKQGDLLWAANIDERKIELKKASFARAGQLSQYYLEYENTIRAVENQKFKAENFSILHAPRGEMTHCGMVLDPAISQKAKADFSAIVVGGVTPKGFIHIADTWAKQGATPREQIDKYFELSKRWECNLHGVESIAYQAVLIHLLREEMFRKKHYFEIVPITHSRNSQSKEERIVGILQPRYANGYIKHNRRFPLLETQLQDFPNGKRDLPDALAMLVHLLDPAAPFAIGEGKDPEEDEYPPLDEVLDGEWRAY